MKLKGGLLFLQNIKRKGATLTAKKYQNEKGTPFWKRIKFNSSGSLQRNFLEIFVDRIKPCYAPLVNLTIL